MCVWMVKVLIARLNRLMMSMKVIVTVQIDCAVNRMMISMVVIVMVGIVDDEQPFYDLE